MGTCGGRVSKAAPPSGELVAQQTLCPSMSLELYSYLRWYIFHGASKKRLCPVKPAWYLSASADLFSIATSYEPSRAVHAKNGCMLFRRSGAKRVLSREHQQCSRGSTGLLCKAHERR